MVLDATRIQDTASLPRDSLLVLNCLRYRSNSLRILTKMRRCGFRGPVLLVSSEPIAKLRLSHRILIWGQNSHQAWTPPWRINSLVELVARLIPIQDGNWHNLQNELRAADRLWERRVLPIVGRLRAGDESIVTEVDSLGQIVDDLCVLTPVACHADANIAGQTVQIQEHFRECLKALRRSAHVDANVLARLRAALESWRGEVVESAEDLQNLVSSEQY